METQKVTIDFQNGWQSNMPNGFTKTSSAQGAIRTLNLPPLLYPTPAVPRFLNTRNLVAICCRVVLLTGMILASTNQTSSPATLANASQIDVLDGDTIRVAGETFRLVGFDAPETHRAQCPTERELGNRATFRLRQIVAAGGSHAARQR